MTPASLELLPERTAPELRYLETKWASHVSYGLAVKALRDFLPMDAALNAMAIRRDTVGAILERSGEGEEGPSRHLLLLEGRYVFRIAGSGRVNRLPPGT
jgi:hypothetical protein